jgi:hypothetical protein
MKRAKVILTALILIGMVGGALAFKAARFTATRVFTTTDAIYSTVAGVTYGANEVVFGEYCTTVPLIYFSNTGLTLEALKTTITPLPRTVTFTAINGSGATITRAVPFCTPTTSLISVVI